MAIGFSALIHTGSGSHPASYAVGTSSFPGVKLPGRSDNHPPQSIAQVKEIVVLYLYSPSVHLWWVVGWILPLYFMNWIFTEVIYLLWIQNAV
jgi:hypothetical protein